MKTLSFLVARLGKAILVVLGVVIINFMLIRLAPGDPAAVLAGESGSSDPAYVEQLRHQFGLDKPVPVQLGIYLKGIAHLDLGFSYRQRLPVFSLIMDRLPATLLLMVCAFLFAVIFGVLAGVIAARARYRGKHPWLDSVMMTLALLVYATPQFWLALLAIIFFSLQLGWLPAFGMETVAGGLQGWARIKDVGLHLILPTLSLGCFFMSVYARLARASMLEVLGQDFIKTARAKGVRVGEIVRRHALRNALLPVVTFAGIQLGQMAGGAVLTETVFGWPGIGSLMFDSLIQRDYPVLLGVFLVTSTMVVVFNLLTDLIYRFIDPRIQEA